jgi:hypothetical protein
MQRMLQDVATTGSQWEDLIEALPIISLLGTLFYQINLFIADEVNNRKVTALSSSHIPPHFAVGGRWSTSFTLTNTSATTLCRNLMKSCVRVARHRF